MSVFPTVVDWSKDGSTSRFLLSTLMVGQPPNRKGSIESLKGDESFRICNHNKQLIILAFALDVKPCTACWLRPSPSYSLLLTRMVYHRVVLSLQFFASCVALDPYFRKCMHDKEHERHLLLLLTYYQLIPPFSSKPHQLSLCCIITFVFRVIMCDDPSFQEQSVYMTRNMKTWFQMFQPWIHMYKDL